jgi:hypothetical protein
MSGERQCPLPWNNLDQTNGDPKSAPQANFQAGRFPIVCNAGRAVLNLKMPSLRRADVRNALAVAGSDSRFHEAF